MTARPRAPRLNHRVMPGTAIRSLLLLVASLSALPAAAQAPVESNTTYLVVRARQIDLPVPDARLNTQIGDKLPLFQQNDLFFIALTTDNEGPTLCAFPLQTREQNRAAWVSAERMVIFAYPASSVPGVLNLQRGEVFPILREDRGHFEVLAERFGRQVTLRIPKDAGVEVVATAPARAAPGSTLRPIERTYRQLAAVTNAEGAVTVVFDPAAAAYMDQVMVTDAKVGIPLSDPSVTLTTGDSLPLFQQNDNYFIVLVNTEYDGLRLCAFPLERNGTRVGWITPEKRFVLADSATSSSGTIYLREGETLPVIGVNDAEYEVLIERSGRWAPLRLPRPSPNLRLIKARTAAPKPAPPPPPRRTIVLKNEPAINQIVLPIPTESPDQPAPRAADALPQPTRPAAGFPPLASTKAPPEATTEPALAEAPADTPSFAAGGTSGAEAPEQASAADGPSPVMASLNRFLSGIWMVLAILGVVLVLILAFASAARRKARRQAEEAPPPPPPEPDHGSDLIAPPVPPPSADFSGSLSSMSIGSVSQFLNSDKESGILTVKDAMQMEIGTMVFVKGEIFDAKTPTRRGVPAVYDIMRCKEGFFTFARGDHSNAERTILEGTITMLLEAHRIMDEEGPKAAAAPKEKPKLRRRPTSHH